MDKHENAKEWATERCDEVVHDVGDDHVEEGGEDDAKNRVLAWCGLGGDDVVLVETKGTPVECISFGLLLLGHLDCCLVRRHASILMKVEECDCPMLEWQKREISRQIYR